MRGLFVVCAILAQATVLMLALFRYWNNKSFPSGYKEVRNPHGQITFMDDEGRVCSHFASHIRALVAYGAWVWHKNKNVELPPRPPGPWEECEK